MSHLALLKQPNWKEAHYRKLQFFVSAGRYTSAVTRGLSKPALKAGTFLLHLTVRCTELAVGYSSRVRLRCHQKSWVTNYYLGVKSFRNTFPVCVRYRGVKRSELPFPGLLLATANFLSLYFLVRLCNISKPLTIYSHTHTRSLFFYHPHWFTAQTVVPQSASWCCSSAVGGAAGP